MAQIDLGGGISFDTQTGIASSGGGVAPGSTPVPIQPATRIGSYTPAPTPPAGGGVGGGYNNPFAKTNPGGMGAPRGTTTPMSDPLAAVRNVLKGMGITVNPYNPFWQRGLQSYSAGMLPQFMANVLRGGADNSVGSGGEGALEAAFGDFIKSNAQGGYQQPTAGQTATNLGEINAGLRKWTDFATQGGYDISTPEGMARATQDAGGGGTLGGFNINQLGVLSQLLNPQAQQDLFMGSYLPVLGPQWGAGVQRALQPIMDNYEYGIAPTFGSGDPFSFLDVLLGSLGIPYSGPVYGK